MENCVAKFLARVSADAGAAVVFVVVVVLSDLLAGTVSMIGSDDVADATTVTLHPKTINVDVKSCAIRPSLQKYKRVGGRRWGTEAKATGNVEN